MEGWMFIHSFVHSFDLETYIAPLQRLLKGCARLTDHDASGDSDASAAVAVWNDVSVSDGQERDSDEPDRVEEILKLLIMETEATITAHQHEISRQSSLVRSTSRLPACLSVCLSVCLSACLSVTPVCNDLIKK